MPEAISIIVIGLTGLMILGRISRANPNGLVQRAFNKTAVINQAIARAKVEASRALVAGAPEDEIKQFPNSGSALDSLTGGGGASGGGGATSPVGGSSTTTTVQQSPGQPAPNTGTVTLKNPTVQTSSGLTPY